MADYSSLTKKELLYTLLARDLMLEERRKENDIQKATINTLIVDHKASKEWYKMQIAEKDKTIENLRIDLKDYQDLEEKISTKYDKVVEKLAEKEKELKAKETLNQIFKDNREAKISFAVEQLEKVKEYIKTNLMSFQKVPIIQEIDNQIKQLKEMK